MDDPAFDFRLMTHADIPMVAAWRARPAVARWWDDPAGAADDLAEDLDDPRVIHWIVSLDTTPMAFLQVYDIAGWDDHPLGFLAKGSRGLDTFIGPDAFRYRGHAARYVRAMAQRLMAEGAPSLGIDPHPDNHAARRAYAKAGFREVGQRETKWGLALLMVML